MFDGGLVLGIPGVGSGRLHDTYDTIKDNMTKKKHREGNRGRGREKERRKKIKEKRKKERRKG